MRKLTPKQRRFVKYYLQTDNATKAVILAGYDIGGKHGTDNPARSAQIIGSENLSKPLIRQAIDKALVKDKITPEYVLSGIARLAETSDKDSDRIKSFELLGKYLKLFGIDQIENKPTNIIIQLGNTPSVRALTDTEAALLGDTEEAQQVSTTKPTG